MFFQRIQNTAARLITATKRYPASTSNLPFENYTGCLLSHGLYSKFCSLLSRLSLLFMLGLPVVVYAWVTCGCFCLDYLWLFMLGLPVVVYAWITCGCLCLGYLWLFMLGLPVVVYAWITCVVASDRDPFHVIKHVTRRFVQSAGNR